MAYFLGFCWALAQATFQLEKRLPEPIENKPIEIIGRIVSIPEEHRDTFASQRTQVFNFKIEHAGVHHPCVERSQNQQPKEALSHHPLSDPQNESSPDNLWPNPGTVRIHFANAPHPLRVGDRWSFTVKLKRPHGYANPGSFDKERHYFLNRLSADGYVITKYETKRLNQEHRFHQASLMPMRLNQAFFNGINVIRAKIFSELRTLLGDSPFFGILAALVVGTRDGISAAQWQVFRDTGTAHLIAISGLHIGLVAGFAFGWVRLMYRVLPEFFLKLPLQTVAAIAAIFAAISYALLAGFTVPTQRAVVMVIVFMLSVILRRRISVWRSYFLALALVLLLDPLSCLGIGFWLSFSAVGVILYGMQNRIAARGVVWRWGRAQWVVFLGLLPVSLAAFQQISWVAPIANLFAIPWVSMTVVPFALTGGILTTIFPKVAAFFIFTAEFSLKLLWPCLQKCIGCLLKVTWVQAEASSVSIAIAGLGMLLLLAPRGFPARKLGVIFLLPMLLQATPKLPLQELRFTVLDVGQGLSAVLETADHVLVFDTGPRLNDNSDAGNQVILPFLATRGIKHIDGIIISHADNDHVGGLSSIAKNMAVKNIISSEPDKTSALLTKTQNQVQLCHAGQKWSWDGVDFEILHPSGNKSKKRNDNSCVLRVQAGEHVILLTGDIEKSAEQLLIKGAALKLASSILVVPHHGSKTSSSAEFIAAVQPQYAIFPMGYQNRYGHPNLEVIERYRRQNSVLLDTVQQGALSFELKPNVPIAKPLSYRIQQQRFWHES